MFSLVADYSDTSSSSDTEDSEDEEQRFEEQNKSEMLPHSNKLVLPSANLLLNSASKSSGVVFNNPFLEAEKAEIDKLQKHVKMVESEEHLVQKNGRKICWNNRKGRCRFGNKCKYAHDSDLTSTGGETEANSGKEEIKRMSPPVNAVVSKSPQFNHMSMDNKPVSSTDTKSRKRPGLGDAIVPGKRVMKQYETTKQKTST